MMFGPGLAGKSTVVKAVRIIYSGKPFEEFIADQRDLVAKLIRKNIVESVNVLCEQAEKLFPAEFAALIKDLQLNLISRKALSVDFTSKQAKIIQALWNSELGQKVWSQREEYEIHDNTIKYLPKCDVVSKDDYSPTQEDYLLAREETKLLTRCTVELPKKDGKESLLEIMDCGGQTNHQEIYKGNPLFKEFSQEACLLFLVIPVGDLLDERRTACVTKGLRILQSLLSTNAKDRNKEADFKRKVVVVFLNKMDKLNAAVDKMGASPLLEYWHNAALNNLGSKEADLINAINSSRRDVGGVEDYFNKVVNFIIKQHRPTSNDAATLIKSTTATKTQDSSVFQNIIDRSIDLALFTIIQDVGAVDEEMNMAAQTGLSSGDIELENLRNKLKPNLEECYKRFDIERSGLSSVQLKLALSNLRQSLDASECLDVQSAEVRDWINKVEESKSRVDFSFFLTKVSNLFHNARRNKIESSLKLVFDEFNVDTNCCCGGLMGLNGKQVSSALTKLGQPFDSPRVKQWLQELDESDRRLDFDTFLEDYMGLFPKDGDESLLSRSPVMNPMKRRSSNFSFADQYAQKENC